MYVAYRYPSSSSFRSYPDHRQVRVYAKRIFVTDGIGDEELATSLSVMETIRQLVHVNVLRYYGQSALYPISSAELTSLDVVFTADPQELVIYMEYLSGGSLANLIRYLGPLEEPQVKPITRQVLQGLVYLHEQPNPVVHRHLSSKEILISWDGTVKISGLEYLAYTPGNLDSIMTASSLILAGRCTRLWQRNQLRLP